MIIFAYNFHHKKTQDFLFYCQQFGYVIDAVLAADWRDLGFPPNQVRTGLRTFGTIHPAEICKGSGIPYYVVEHNSDESLRLLAELQPEIGVVAGSRILSADVISLFSKGIINFHPGLIPEVRGIDCTQWAIYEGLPLGVTSHLIDERVDAGLIIRKLQISEYPDDTIIDLGERLFQGQLEIFSETIDTVINNSVDTFSSVERGSKPPYSHFPPELIPEFVKRFAKRFPDTDPFQLKVVPGIPLTQTD